jgi:hypothetical protein
MSFLLESIKPAKQASESSPGCSGSGTLGTRPRQPIEPMKRAAETSPLCRPLRGLDDAGGA